MKNKRYDVVCFGIAMVDIVLAGLPGYCARSEMNFAKDFSFGVGGDAVNQSIILTRLGYNTVLSSKVGNDVMGGYLLNQLVEDGVDISAVVKDEQVKTPITVVVVDNNGERSFITCLKGTSLDSFQYEDIDMSCVENTKLLSLGSIYANPRLNGQAVADIMKHAKAYGTITCADIVKVSKDDTLDKMKEALPFIDYILPNEEEAAFYTKEKDPDKMAECFLDYGVKNVIIKLSKRGCFIKNRQQSMLIPSYMVIPIDTTGAGDNFTSGFIAGLLEGYAIEDCGKYANAVASISVQSIGATSGVKSRDQVLDILKNNKSVYKEARK